MRFATLVGALASIYCCAASAPDRPLVAADSQAPLFRNGHEATSSDFRIPTSRESAVMARRILGLTPLGTLSTVFPGSPSPQDSGLAGVPIGMMDYVADCEPAAGGNPTILAISIATSFRNVRAGSNISLALAWTPPHPPAKRISLLSFLGFVAGSGQRDPVPYSAANLPRFSLIGYLEPIEGKDAELAKCFTDVHPDAKYWLPGNRIHKAEWVRLVVTSLYWVGGFGDRAYIGWIPVEEWRNVTEAEWKGIRLPGETKGWKEWATAQFADMEL